MVVVRSILALLLFSFVFLVAARGVLDIKIFERNKGPFRKKMGKKVTLVQKTEPTSQKIFSLFFFVA